LDQLGCHIALSQQEVLVEKTSSILFDQSCVARVPLGLERAQLPLFWHQSGSFSGRDQGGMRDLFEIQFWLSIHQYPVLG
jgi:hypothetical protein